MAVPTIDPESSVLSYPQWETWEHTFSASGSPYRFDVASGGFPTGLSFQPLSAITGANSGDVFSCVGHPFANGHLIGFTGLSSTSLGVNHTSRYFVVNRTADTYQVSATLGGSPIALTGDISAGYAFRIGYVRGAATVPGISKVRLTATNGDGTSAEVLFTIGTEPGAGAIDEISDLVWDLGTNIVSLQNGSVVQAPADSAAPVLSVKEGDDFLIRLRFLKGGTFVSLAVNVEGGDLRLVAKEFEPEGPIFATTEFEQSGTGTAAYYLIYGKLEGNALAGALSGNENDKGTFLEAVAEIEVTYENPTEIGPAVIVRTSATFKMRIERDIANNA